MGDCEGPPGPARLWNLSLGQGGGRTRPGYRNRGGLGPRCLFGNKVRLLSALAAALARLEAFVETSSKNTAEALRRRGAELLATQRNLCVSAPSRLCFNVLSGDTMNVGVSPDGKLPGNDERLIRSGMSEGCPGTADDFGQNLRVCPGAAAKISFSHPTVLSVVSAHRSDHCSTRR